MRGVLVNKEAKLLFIMGFVELGLGIKNLFAGCLGNIVFDIALGSFLILLAIASWVVWFRVNYPRIPKWAVGEMKNWGERPQLRKLGE